MAKLSDFIEVKKVDNTAYIVEANSISNTLSRGTMELMESILKHNGSQAYDLSRPELVKIHDELDKAINSLTKYNKHILKLIQE